jgi:hypothetical protein
MSPLVVAGSDTAFAPLILGVPKLGVGSIAGVAEPSAADIHHPLTPGRFGEQLERVHPRRLLARRRSGHQAATVTRRKARDDAQARETATDHAVLNQAAGEGFEPSSDLTARNGFRSRNSLVSPDESVG